MECERIVSNEPLLDEIAIAKYLGVSKRSIERYRIEQGLPYIKFGRQIKFRLSSVDQWIASKERN